jgi:hypothetical protein
MGTEDRLRAVGCVDGCTPATTMPPDRDAISSVLVSLISQGELLTSNPDTRGLLTESLHIQHIW